jgi:predicted nucleotidyltransferase
VDELPLKVFVRDMFSNSPFTGYQNKKKKLFYYKTREAGTKINISAKKLNSHFEKLLQKFEYDNSGREKLKTLLNQKLSKHFDDNTLNFYYLQMEYNWEHLGTFLIYLASS